MHQTIGTDNVAYSFKQRHHLHAIISQFAYGFVSSFLNCKLYPITFQIKDNTFKITIPSGT